MRRPLAKAEGLPHGCGFSPVDRRVMLVGFLCFWVLYGLVEQRPFALQGAVLESLVERGRLHFRNVRMVDGHLENGDTATESFRPLVNVFPHRGAFYVNHAPGQFVLAAPWYAACVAFGIRFETHTRLVWRLLQWTFIGPLCAVAVVSLFAISRLLGRTRTAATLSALAFGLASPWWGASGVLYHDSLALSLVLAGCALALSSAGCRPRAALVRCIAAGAALGWALFTTYLVVPMLVVVVPALLLACRRRTNIRGLVVALAAVAALLPLSNMVTYGWPFSTGYSAGAFRANYPALWDLKNAVGKIHFYLLSSQHGMIAVFPVFLLGAVNLLHGRSLRGRVRLVLALAATAHLGFCITVPHDGSLGWGVGRFLLPLFPVLALGLPAPVELCGWGAPAWRALLTGGLVYSGLHGLAAAWYGVNRFSPGHSLPGLLLQLRGVYYVALPVVCLALGYFVNALRREGSVRASVAPAPASVSASHPQPLEEGTQREPVEP